MAKTLTLRVDDELYNIFAAAAAAEGRSIANLIETAAFDNLRERQFVDDAEMAEITANERLVTRLQKGSHDARLRKGRFVE